MRRLLQAPNLAIATLWADQLRAAGIATSVQRAYASSIAGEIPPDQALPEVWVEEDTDQARLGVSISKRCPAGSSRTRTTTLPCVSANCTVRPSSVPARQGEWHCR